MLSQTGEYALRAALYLAEHGADRAVQVSEMARALGLPRDNDFDEIVRRYIADEVSPRRRS